MPVPSDCEVQAYLVTCLKGRFLKGDDKDTVDVVTGLRQSVINAPYPSVGLPRDFDCNAKVRHRSSCLQRPSASQQACQPVSRPHLPCIRQQEVRDLVTEGRSLSKSSSLSQTSLRGERMKGAAAMKVCKCACPRGHRQIIPYRSGSLNRLAMCMHRSFTTSGNMMCSKSIVATRRYPIRAKEGCSATS